MIGTKRIGGSQHFSVVLPTAPGSFWAAAKAAGVEHKHDDMRRAIETTSFEQAILRGNYWCKANGMPVDDAAPRGFTFIDTPEYAAAVQAGVANQLDKKIPQGWNLVAVHGRTSAVLPENEWHQAARDSRYGPFRRLASRQRLFRRADSALRMRDGVSHQAGKQLWHGQHRTASCERVEGPGDRPLEYVFASKNGRLETREGKWAFEGTPRQIRVPMRRFHRWALFRPGYLSLRITPPPQSPPSARSSSSINSRCAGSRSNHAPPWNRHRAYW
jgi:hypothetical protein